MSDNNEQFFFEALKRAEALIAIIERKEVGRG
jgi:hypothetical protein